MPTLRPAAQLHLCTAAHMCRHCTVQAVGANGAAPGLLPPEHRFQRLLGLSRFGDSDTRSPELARHHGDKLQPSCAPCQGPCLCYWAAQKAVCRVFMRLYIPDQSVSAPQRPLQLGGPVPRRRAVHPCSDPLHRARPRAGRGRDQAADGVPPACGGAPQHRAAAGVLACRCWLAWLPCLTFSNAAVVCAGDRG